MSTPSPEQIEAAKTARGGWTKKQLAEWGVPWPPPKGWRQNLIARHREPDQIHCIKADAYCFGQRHLCSPQEIVR